jgi:hypothetical protein
MKFTIIEEVSLNISCTDFYPNWKIMQKRGQNFIYSLKGSINFIAPIFTLSVIGVTWLIALRGRGGQNRPCVLGALIYEGVKLERKKFTGAFVHLVPTKLLCIWYAQLLKDIT